MCQVCTVAIIGGLGISRWLCVDDTISGVWIGALLVIAIYYTNIFLRSRKIVFFGSDFLVALAYYLLTLIPLYLVDIIGHPSNRILGIDKLFFGIFFGDIIFITSVKLYLILKKKNGGHAHFPMEKVVIPILSLAIASGIFYLIT